MSPRLLGLAAALALVTFAAQAIEPRLRARTTVDADVITLGDVLDGSGAAADAVVARAPEPGQRMIIGVAHIYAVARASGLAWRPLYGLDRVMVRRASRRVTRSDIEEHLSLALAEKMPGANLRVELANRAFEIHLPTDVAAATLDVETITYSPRNGRFRAVLVTTRGSSRGARIEVIGRAFEMVEMPVLRQRMQRGEIISEDDVVWTELRVDRLPPTAITSTAELVGRTPRRTLRPGTPIRAGDVRVPTMVKKGTVITMSYRTAAMVLTTPGRALDDGALGDTIRVLNSQTKIVVDATVSGNGHVSVAPASPPGGTRIAGAYR